MQDLTLLQTQQGTSQGPHCLSQIACTCQEPFADTQTSHIPGLVSAPKHRSGEKISAWHGTERPHCPGEHTPMCPEGTHPSHSEEEEEEQVSGWGRTESAVSSGSQKQFVLFFHNRIHHVLVLCRGRDRGLGEGCTQ